MLSILFNFFIQPIICLISIIFEIIYDQTLGNLLFSIFTVSIFVNFICLPLYIKAEEIRDKTRTIENKLAEKVKSIKKNFKGDERYFLLKTYYRQNNYHPIMAINNSLSLLIQIPFFMAAYYFFSHCNFLQGYQVGILNNLGMPDGLINIFGKSINGLPILMTLVNVLSTQIYCRNKPLKDKVQMYLCTFIFLILLYNSPSGLVIYWTINNLFSLFKNIISISKNPKLIFKKIIYMLIFVYSFVILIKNFLVIDFSLRAFIFDLIKIAFLVCFIFLVKNIRNFKNVKFNFPKYEKNLTDISFLLSNFLLWCVVGIYVPSNAIATSPSEFIFAAGFSHPLLLIVWTSAVALGTLMFWFVYIYYLTNSKYRFLFLIMSLTLNFTFILNILTFKNTFGTLDYMFLFNNFKPIHTNIFENLIIFSLFIAVFYIFYKIISNNKYKIVMNVLLILIFSVTTICTKNFIKINRVYKEVIGINEEAKKPFFIDFSKTEKNVLILFLDRGINSYFMSAVKNIPELKNMYSDFTYYPNTLSFGGQTMYAYPPLSGGYEYTPININKDNRKLKDKFNDALLVLPTLFKNNDFNVTVLDAPLADFQHITNPQFYIQRGFNYKNLITYKTQDRNIERLQKNHILRNINFYSLFIVLPKNLKNFAYNDGYYHGNYLDEQVISNYDNLYAQRNLSALMSLFKMTRTNSDKNSFVFINNSLAHEVINPENEEFMKFKKFVKDEKLLDENEFGTNYHTNIFAYWIVGKYINYLKELGVYDNTRIIVVSDHGFFLYKNPKESDFFNKYVLSYNPILLYKDFDEHHELRIDYKFMTNADTPYLATNRIIKNPKNPFTQKLITDNEDIKKHELPVFGIFDNFFWPIDFEGNGYLDLKDAPDFVYVKDNIFDKNNWRK